MRIAGCLKHVGFTNFDEVQVHTGIERDIAVLRALSNNLPVHLALGRNVDDEVTLNFRLARKPAAGIEIFASLPESGFDLTDRRQVICF